MSDFDLFRINEDHQALREAIREIAEEQIAPYAAAAGLDLETAGALTEMAHAESPKGVRSVVKKVLGVREEPTALCTHRPVLPTVLDVLRTHGNKHLAAQLPTEDPYLVPGEMLVMQISRRNNHRMISLEQIRPFGD